VWKKVSRVLSELSLNVAKGKQSSVRVVTKRSKGQAEFCQSCH